MARVERALPVEIVERGNGTKQGQPPPSRIDGKTARREISRVRPAVRTAAAPQQGRQRTKIVPLLALASALGLLALGLVQPVGELIRGHGADSAKRPPVEARPAAPARAVATAAESDNTPAQPTLISLQQMTAATATPRQEVRVAAVKVDPPPQMPVRLMPELPPLPATAILSQPPVIERPAHQLAVAVPAQLTPAAILVPEAGRLVAKIFAKTAKNEPADASGEGMPLASAAVDIDWLMAFTTPDETFIDPTVPSVPMLLPEPPLGWQLGAVATVEASVPSRKRVSFVDFAMRPVPAETGERYVPEAASRSEGYAVHPPLAIMELPDSQRLREIILAHETARKARIAAAAKAKAIAAERDAMNNIDGRSISCLPSAIKQVLFDLTRLFGPVHVNSSFRSPSHNRSVGGASRSLHMECRAVDFRVAGNQQRVIKYLVNRSDVGGFKHYGGHIHIDNGPRRTW